MNPLADNPREAGLVKLFVVPVPFKIISKSNEKNPGGYLSAKYRTFENSVARLAQASCGQPRLKKGWVVIRLHFKNHVHPDFSNCPKGCLDALVKAGVFGDDKYVACNVPPAMYGDENSEIEIWA